MPEVAPLPEENGNVDNLRTNQRAGRAVFQVQRPLRHTFCHVLRNNAHWKCLTLTLFIDLCGAIILWCQITGYLFVSEDDAAQVPKMKGYAASALLVPSGPCDRGYHFIPIAFSVMLYIVYLMECWHCNTRMILSCNSDAEQIYKRIATMSQTLPVVWWRAVCYHYIRRTRQVTRYRNGDAVTTTQVYYERINTHSAGTVYLYHEAGVKDISRRVVDLENQELVRVRFSKGFLFASLQSANEFEDQRATFFHENEQKDDYMEVREGMDLMDFTFKENLMMYGNIEKRPWYCSQFVFWLCSFLLLSWPLRILIEYKTAYLHYHVTKLFGTNYVSPSNRNYTGPGNRMGNAGDSNDVSAANEISAGGTNYVIVPSYSEALLMDPVDSSSVCRHDRGGNVVLSSRQRYSQVRDCPSLLGHRIYTNYGATVPDGQPMVVRRNQALSTRSRSLSQIRASPARRKANSNEGMRPSRSIGSFIAMASHGWNAIFGGSTQTHQGHQRHRRHEDIPEEPPPTYEAAIEMCRPLFARIRRSLTVESARVQPESVDASLASDVPGPSHITHIC